MRSNKALAVIAFALPAALSSIANAQLTDSSQTAPTVPWGQISKSLAEQLGTGLHVTGAGLLAANSNHRRRFEFARITARINSRFRERTLSGLASAGDCAIQRLEQQISVFTVLHIRE